MRKPVIGILGNLIIEESSILQGLERSYVNDDYIKSVSMAGGIPLIIPVNTDKEVVENQVRCVDGILISGGYDVNPLLYGEEATAKQGFTYPEVDKFDFLAIEAALRLGKPILGICRGVQILNVYSGGSLYQDVYQRKETFVKHEQNCKRYIGSHTTEFVQGSKLYEIFGPSALTNSFHHQAVKDVARGFKVAARAKDGIIEAIEKDGEEFVVGVQWHPEMMAANDPKMLVLFEKFITHCIK